MKLAFIGIGALGGYFGGRLSEAGNDVVFIARGATLEALRKNGLRVESPLGDFSHPQVHATDNPASAGPVDAVFVTTKAWQVSDAAQQIRGMVGPETAVIPFQNGVDAYDVLAAVLGPEHVLGGMCHIIAMVAAPGVIRHVGLDPLITIGEWDNARTPRVARLVECLGAAGKVRVPESIRRTVGEVRVHRLVRRGGRGDAGADRGYPQPARDPIVTGARDAGDCGSGTCLRGPGAGPVGRQPVEIHRLAAARGNRLDAA